jgi:hypothetical protein
VCKHKPDNPDNSYIVTTLSLISRTPLITAGICLLHASHSWHAAKAHFLHSSSQSGLSCDLDSGKHDSLCPCTASIALSYYRNSLCGTTTVSKGTLTVTIRALTVDGYPDSLFTCSMAKSVCFLCFFSFFRPCFFLKKFIYVF